MLAFANNSDPFILDTDASNYAIGGELIQLQNGKERAIAYGSFSLTKEQLKYCTTRKVLLAVVRFTRQFRHYLLGRRFVVRTDHSSLTWLLNFKEPQGQLARWLEELSQYNMIVEHRPGKKHENADALSCIQSEHEFCFRTTDLPCGGCHHCIRAHENWAGFTEVVDNVIPLNACASGGRTVAPLAIEKEEIPLHTSLEVTRTDTDVFIRHSHEMVFTAAVAASHPNSYQTNYSHDTLKVAQKTDQDIELIYDWLLTKIEPSDTMLFRSNQADKSYWINRNLFYLDKDGLLRSNSPDGTSDRLVVRRKFVDEILALCHDIPTSGHQGINRTKLKVKEDFYWYKMDSEIKEYVRTCHICNKNKKPQEKHVAT